jgi:FkbM family methyltransferase
MQGALKRPHDSDFKALTEFELAAGALVLDIGANTGQAARSIFGVVPSIKLISFEPNPTHWQALEMLATKRPGFTFFGCALSDKESNMWLYCPVYRGCEFTPLASLDERAATTWLNEDTLFGFRSNDLTVNKELVEVKTLDSFMFTPSLIKIDVEGGSLGVLEGAVDTLQRSRPLLLIEEVREADEVDVFLARRDYVPFARNPHSGALDKKRYGAANTYFVPREHRLVRV